VGLYPLTIYSLYLLFYTMEKKSYMFIGVIIVVFIVWLFGMYKFSDDTDARLILQQELLLTEESISWVNYQLSGLKQERADLRNSNKI